MLVQRFLMLPQLVLAMVLGRNYIIKLLVLLLMV